MNGEAAAASCYAIAAIICAGFAWNCFSQWIHWKLSLNLTDARVAELERSFYELEARLKKATVETAKGVDDALSRLGEQMSGLEFKIGSGGHLNTRIGPR